MKSARNIFTFFIVAFLSILIISNPAGSIDNAFPLLPNGNLIFGGKINIINKCVTNISSGIVLDSNFEKVLQMNFINSNLEYFTNTDVLIKNSFSLSSANNINYNKDLSLISKYNPGCIKPKYILSSSSQYLHAAGIILKTNPQKKSYKVDVDVYDAETMTLMYKIKDINKSFYVNTINKDLITFSDDKTILLNAKTGEVYLNNIQFERYDYDLELFVTTSEIFDIKTKATIADISRFELTSKPRINKDELMFLTQVGKNNSLITILTRKGELIEKRKIQYPCDASDYKVYQLIDIYNDYSIGLILTNNSMVYRIFNINNGYIYYSYECNRDSSNFSYFSESKCIIRTRKGAMIINLSTMKPISYLNFPVDPHVMPCRDKYFITVPSFDNSGQAYGFLLGDDLRLLPDTTTLLPNDAEFYEYWKDCFVTLTRHTIINENEDCWRISTHVIGSTTPQKCFYYSHRTSNNYTYKYQEGHLYLTDDSGFLTILNCEDGTVKRIALINNNSITELIPSIHIENNLIAVCFLNKNTKIDNKLVCYNLNENNKLLEKSFNNQINILVLTKNFILLKYYDIKQNNIIEITYFDTGETKSFNGDYITFINEIIYYTKSKLDISKMENNYYLIAFNVKSKEEAHTLIKDHLYPPISVISGYINTSNGKIFDSNGILIQNNVGYFSEISNNAHNNSKILQHVESGMLIKFDKCPTFSIKRLNTNLENQFKVEIYRNDKSEYSNILNGEVYIVPWGGNPNLDVSASLNASKVRFNLEAIGPKNILEISFPLNSISTDYFALIIESNGLLDTKNSELSDFDKEGRPLFDGVPTSLEKQQAIVVTVWKK